MDAFTIDWSVLKFYAFLPFSIIAAVLNKIKEDIATGGCILPYWPTEPYWPIGFLAPLFSAGLGYSAINTARSALSSVLVLPNNITFGSHPSAVRFLNGVFVLKP